MQKVSTITELVNNIVELLKNKRYLLEHIDMFWIIIFGGVYAIRLYKSDDIITALKDNFSELKFIFIIWILLIIFATMYSKSNKKNENKNKTTKPGIGIIKLDSELTKEETENKMFLGKLKNEVEEYYEIKTYSVEDVSKYYKNGQLDQKIFKAFNLKLIFIVAEETGYDKRNNSELTYRLEIKRIFFDNLNISDERKKQIDYELKLAFNKYIKIYKNDNLNQRQSGATILKIQISNIMAMIFEVSGNIKEQKNSMKFLYDNIREFYKKNNNRIDYIKKRIPERIVRAYHNYLKIIFEEYNYFRSKSFIKELKKTIDEKKEIEEELHDKGKIDEVEYICLNIETRLLYAFYFLIMNDYQSVYEIFNNLYYENKLPSLAIKNVLEMISSIRSSKLSEKKESYYAILELMLFERRKINVGFKEQNSKKVIIKTLIKTWTETKDEIDN